MTQYLDRFEIIRSLGNGSFGEVFLAKSSGAEGFEKHVALKRLHTTQAEDAELVERFAVEARICGHLNHENVTRVLDFIDSSDGFLLTMEYLTGLELHKILHGFTSNGRIIPLSSVADIIYQLCEGLHFVHHAKTPDGEPLNLIHRDIKPNNIMVTTFGVLKIMDFGVARTALARTKTGSGFKGTLQYMAPEQALEERLTPNVDQFAAALIFVEMLTGEPVYGAKALPKLMMQVTKGDVSQGLERLESTFPAAVPVAERALARDPGARFPNLRIFGQAARSVCIAAKPAPKLGAMVSAMMGNDGLAYVMNHGRVLASTSMQPSATDSLVNASPRKAPIPPQAAGPQPNPAPRPNPADPIALPRRPDHHRPAAVDLPPLPGAQLRQAGGSAPSPSFPSPPHGMAPQGRPAPPPPAGPKVSRPSGASRNPAGPGAQAFTSPHVRQVSEGEQLRSTPHTPVADPFGPPPREKHKARTNIQPKAKPTPQTTPPPAPDATTARPQRVESAFVPPMAEDPDEDLEATNPFVSRREGRGLGFDLGSAPVPETQVRGGLNLSGAPVPETQVAGGLSLDAAPIPKTQVSGGAVRHSLPPAAQLAPAGPSAHEPHPDFEPTETRGQGAANTPPPAAHAQRLAPAGSAPQASEPAPPEKEERRRGLLIFALIFFMGAAGIGAFTLMRSDDKVALAPPLPPPTAAPTAAPTAPPPAPEPTQKRRVPVPPKRPQPAATPKPTPPPPVVVAERPPAGRLILRTTPGYMGVRVNAGCGRRQIDPKALVGEGVELPPGPCRLLVYTTDEQRADLQLTVERDRLRVYTFEFEVDSSAKLKVDKLWSAGPP